MATTEASARKSQRSERKAARRLERAAQEPNWIRRLLRRNAVRRVPEPVPIIRLYVDPTIRFRRTLIAALLFFCLIYGFYFGMTAPYRIVPMLLPMVLMACGIVWALPDAPNPPTRFMEGAFFTYCVILIMWPDYLALDLPGLPWITLRRLVGIPMALSLLVCASVSSEFRRNLSAIYKATPISLLLVIIFSIIQFVTIIASNKLTDSMQKVIIQQVDWTSTVFIAAFIFQRSNRPTQWVNMMWAMAVLVALTGLLEATKRQVLWAGHVPSFLMVPESAHYLSPNIRSATGAYRAKAVFSTPLGLAEYLAIVTPFVLHKLFEKEKLITKLSAGLSVILFVSSILATDSRLGLVGALASALVYGILWSFIRWRRHPTSLIGPALIAIYPVVFIAAVASTFLVHRLRVKIWGSGAQQASNETRMEQLQTAIPKLMHRPWGYGAGRAGDTVGLSRAGTITVDNYFITVALDYGVIGLISFLGIIVASIFYAGRRQLSSEEHIDPEGQLLTPLAGALIAFVVIKWVFSQPDSHPIIFMMVGMIAALIAREKFIGNPTSGVVAAEKFLRH